MAGSAGDGTTWGDANNWTSGFVVDQLPSASPDITFNPQASSAGTISLGEDRVANTVSFLDDYTLLGNTLHLVTGNISVAAGVTASIDSDISATLVTKTGAGTLELSGSSSSLTILEGTLAVGGPSSGGSVMGISASAQLAGQSGQEKTVDFSLPVLLEASDYRQPELPTSSVNYVSSQTLMRRRTVAVEERVFANPLLLDETNGSDSTNVGKAGGERGDQWLEGHGWLEAGSEPQKLLDKVFGRYL